MSETIRAAKSGRLSGVDDARIRSPTGIFTRRPGPGKAVILSYLSQQETARPASCCRLRSALMPVAGGGRDFRICAWLLNAPAKTMCGAERRSKCQYALIAGFRRPAGLDKAED